MGWTDRVVVAQMLIGGQSRPPSCLIPFLFSQWHCGYLVEGLSSKGDFQTGQKEMEGQGDYEVWQESGGLPEFFHPHYWHCVRSHSLTRFFRKF